MSRTNSAEFRFSTKNPLLEVQKLRAELTPGTPRHHATPPPSAELTTMFTWSPGPGTLPILGYRWRIPEMGREWLRSDNDGFSPTTGFINLVPNTPLTIEAKAIGALESGVATREYLWEVPEDQPTAEGEILDDSMNSGYGTYALSVTGLTIPASGYTVAINTIGVPYNLSMTDASGNVALLAYGNADVFDGVLSLPLSDDDGLVDLEVMQTFTLVLNTNPVTKVVVVSEGSDAA